MLNYDEFNKEIIELYRELNLKYDEHHFDHLNGLGKVSDFLKSVSYIFPPAIGSYKGRTLEIRHSYSYNLSTVISATGGTGSPSIMVKSGINKASYDYMVIRLEMKTDIGTPSILICPNIILNKIFGMYAILRRTTKTNYREFDKKYLIALGDKKWFLKCLNPDIMYSMNRLDLPKYRGAIFQFSENHCTFAILPQAIGKDKVMQIIDILEKITSNIETEFVR